MNPSGLSRTAQIRQQQAAAQRPQAPWAATLRQKALLALDARNSRKRGPKTARAIRPNAGIEAAYRQAIVGLIEEMNNSVFYWLRASFKANEPEVAELAQDALPATELRKAVRALARRWQRRFNRGAPKLARWFAQKVHDRSMADMHKALKQGGWYVEAQFTQAQQDILIATVQQNVSLIRSIPQQYFTQIEGMVMRSVQTGRDLQQLTNDLQRQFRVTRKRAILIARDQNNKASAALVRARQIELGITEAIWVHSAAGKEPRPTHVANNGKRYNVKTGWFDPHERKWIHPGELINCRCFQRSVIPGFV